jgi:hypothetical protein
MTVLVLVLWLAVGKIIAAGLLGESFAGLPCRGLAAGLSPWEAILEATRPYVHNQPALGWLGTPVHLFLVTSAAIALLLDGVAVAMVRVWNPSREGERGEGRGEREEEQTSAAGTSPSVAASASAGVAAVSVGAAVELPQQPASEASDSLSRLRSPLSPLTTRRVWDNPIIWREIRTWAYGRRILVVRLAYLVLFALAAAGLYLKVGGESDLILVGLALLSLVLVNAQAVTSLTSERDARALDLLLVTDLTPKEIVFGKLGGVLYNTKEMVLLPMLLCVGLWSAGGLSFENLLFLLGGMAVLYAFAAVLGLHAGMTYANSGAAIATSLGTLFFLFLGVGVCMRIMMAFSGSFTAQFLPFFTFMVFGGVGLYAVLGLRNPSSAIGVASFICPIATFYAITSYLMEPPSPLAMFLVTTAAYGFTVAAMLVPAIYEFDVATGRTTLDE